MRVAPSAKLCKEVVFMFTQVIHISSSHLSSPYKPVITLQFFKVDQSERKRVTEIEMMAKTVDGDERVIATAQHILKSLGTSENAKEDMIFILSNLGNRFADINQLLTPQKSAFERRLDSAEEVIENWEAMANTPKKQCFLFAEDCPDDAAAYLTAVDEIVQLTEDFAMVDDEIKVSREIRDRAENVLQLTMSRLEDEFRNVLVRNVVPLDLDSIHACCDVSQSLALNSTAILDSENSFGGEQRTGSGLMSFGDLALDLINPDAIYDLKDISDRMIRAGYEKECCQVYTSVRRESLDECLLILGVEKLGIEEVLKIEWVSLDEKMMKWSQAVKLVFKVILTEERRLCDQVFSGSESIKEVCFGEISKGCVMQLMTFAEAVTIGKRSSEKLFRILDMYDALTNVLPDLQGLYSNNSGEYICSEVQEIVSSLGEAAKGTFEEFENAIKGEASRKPTQFGEIHPLTRYVMNYVKLLADYSEILNLLLENDTSESSSPACDDNADDALRLGNGSPLAGRLLLIITFLESNLEEKSKLYDDTALKHIFVMNNIHYVVHKVKDTDLGKFLGDQWVRKHRGQIRQNATNYLRACWSKVLSCLKNDGFGGSSGSGSGGSSNASKIALKEKFKNFNSCFEEVYKNQTAWKVPDPQLREELRISISEKVLPAYRAFMGRFRSHLESGKNAGKYIKYTPEDLENFLLHFFEGTPCTLHHPRRKNST